MTLYRIGLLLIGLLYLTPQNLTAQKVWRISRGPSTVEFNIHHIVFSTVTGRFKKFNGTLVQPGPDFSDAQIEVTIDVSSLSTGNWDRDAELLGSDFFQADQFPEITFESTSMQKKDEQNYQLKGLLTIRGITHPIELAVTYQGIHTLASGKDRADFIATGSLNRFDYGIRWNPLLEAGNVIVSQTVDLSFHIALLRTSNP